MSKSKYHNYSLRQLLEAIRNGRRDVGVRAGTEIERRIASGYPAPTSTADRLPPGDSDILWWYSKPPNVGWRLGWYASDKRYPLGCFTTNESCWFLCDGPTWWMYPPPAPEEANNVSTL